MSNGRMINMLRLLAQGTYRFEYKYDLALVDQNMSHILVCGHTGISLDEYKFAG